MRAVQHDTYGGTEVLMVTTVDLPAPGPAEVRLDVSAAGVNPLDVVYRTGGYEPASLPAIPGSDVAGVVVETGSDVTEFSAGDRVVGTGEGANPNAGYAEAAVVDVGHLAHLPDGVSFEAAAGIGIPGLTAWRALIDHGDIDPGATVLVHGGTGGVGHIAVQLAASAGASVITTGGTDDGRSRIDALGADAVFDYDSDSLAADIAAAGEPDVILDANLDSYLELDIEVAAQGGRIVTIFGDIPAVEKTATARRKELQLQAMALSNTPDVRFVLSRLAKLLATDRLSVHVDRTFDLTAAADAHELLADGDFFGKLVVVP
jgi:NADPH:quinone reductase-like Zn-dependent oxidoreductase